MFIQGLGEVVNLTPHCINIVIDDQELVIDPVGKPFRLAEHDLPGDNPLIVERKLGLTDELPAPAWVPAQEHRCSCNGPQPRAAGQPGACQCGLTQFVPVLYIISLPALMGLGAAGVIRGDVVAPDSGSTAIRDASGQIRAVRRFVRLSA